MPQLHDLVISNATFNVAQGAVIRETVDSHAIGLAAFQVAVDTLVGEIQNVHAPSSSDWVVAAIVLMCIALGIAIVEIALARMTESAITEFSETKKQATSQAPP